MKNLISKNHKKLVQNFLNEKVNLEPADLYYQIEYLLKHKEMILKLANSKNTPFYLYDSSRLRKNATDFMSLFQKSCEKTDFFYAIKCNNYEKLLKDLVQVGFNFDASSRREAEMAIKVKGKKILLSGPGKTDEEIIFALKNKDRIIINVDSLNELDKIVKLAPSGHEIKVGARINFDSSRWNRFGMPIQDLKIFQKICEKSGKIKFIGIQSHASWNKDAKSYIERVNKISRFLKNNFSNLFLSELQFIDLGGGFIPYQAEAFLPCGLPQGEVVRTAADYYHQCIDFQTKYFFEPSVPLPDYVLGISQAIRKKFNFLKNCRYFFEPGRIIAYSAMHLVLKIVDIKKSGLILDGGINMFSYDKLNYYYSPIVNLTRPSLREKKINLFGPLCTPLDIMGKYCYAENFAIGDIIAIPFQGAYSYSFAHNFIKPIPSVYEL